MIPTFKSRFGLWSIRLGIAIPAVMVAGLVVFELGGCVLGLNSPGGCSRIPDLMGEWALVAGVLGVYLSIYVTPVMVIGGGIAEWLARRR